MCGYESSLNYCPNCGTYPLEEEIITCTSCGHKNSKVLYYCSRCGAPLAKFASSGSSNIGKDKDTEDYYHKIGLEETKKKKINIIASFIIGGMLLFAIFYYIGFVNNPNSKLEHQLPQSYNAIITTKITNIDAEVGETQIWIALPVNCDTQQNVSIVRIDPEPDKITLAPEACTKICYWNLEDSINKNSTITITQEISFTANPFTTPIDTSKVEKYDTNSEIYKEYTKPSQKVESDDSEIVAMAKNIVGNETNPYKKANRIYGWVVKNITYEVQDQELGARYAFYNRKGDCTEFSTLFVAMCRSQGIPARLVHGYLYSSDTSAGHMWAEFYLPPYGWVPADPTGDNLTKSRFFFGRLGSNVLILSKGNIGTSSKYTENSPFAFSYIAYYKTYNSDKLIFENNAEIKKVS